MAPPHTTRAPPEDDLDDLFNFTSNNNNATTSSPPANTTARRRLAGDDPLATGLGIDSEIKVRKARAPIAKLDEERLLSQNGIPKLRRIAKQRLKFKGKGHEFSDISRLLNTYQLWLDELFPKANLADGVAIIEKLGHKKRLQTMRRAWIDEDRPKVIDLEAEDEVAPEQAHEEDVELQIAEEGGEQIGQPQLRSSSPIMMELNDEGLYDEPEAPQNASDEHEHEPDEDELDALMAEDAASSHIRPQAADAILQDKPAENDDDDDEDMDALDALLAEDAAKAPQAPIQPSKVVEQDDFGDDEEAMAAMEAW
jgi:replication fork protection complex subunit Csm3/Swi3